MQGNPVWGPVWGPVWLPLGGQRTGGEIYTRAVILVANAGKPCLGPRVGPRMAVSRWPTNWRGYFHLVRVCAHYGFFWLDGPPLKKPIYLRCTRELPQTPAGAPAPHGAAGLHAKSCAAWAAWGRDQGPAPSETQHGYFRDRAAHPSMKTLIGCRNDGPGTGSQRHQLAWPRDAARSTSPRRSFSVRTIRL